MSNNPPLQPASDPEPPPGPDPVLPGKRSRPQAERRIRVLLVDDHPVVREGIRSCMDGNPHVEIVGEAADGHDAVAKVEQLQPDVVLMDINIPRLNGMAATEVITQRAPEARVLALTAYHNTEYVQRSLAAGARGYVLKDASPQELLQAIQTVHEGGTFFSREIADAVLKGALKDGGLASNVALSARETEVLALIAAGSSNKEIAAVLHIGVRTVETHRERLMEKLDIRSIAGLTKYAVLRGLAKLE